MVQFCARVIAPGTQESARPSTLRIPAWVQTATVDQFAWAPAVAWHQLQFLGLAPLDQGATLTTLTLSQLTVLGQPGVSGVVAVRAVGEDPEQGLASARHPQLEANHVMDKPMRKRPVSRDNVQVSPNILSIQARVL